jgi:nucleoid DNA-binding protein
MAPKQSSTRAAATKSPKAEAAPKKTPAAPKKAPAAATKEGHPEGHVEPKHQKYISENFAERVLVKYEKEEGQVPPGLTKKVARALLVNMIQVIVDDLVEGKDTSITNFVTFKRNVRLARSHRNPQERDGKMVDKPDMYYMKVECKPHIKTLLEKVPVSQEDVEKARAKAAHAAALGLKEEDEE